MNQDSNKKFLNLTLIDAPIQTYAGDTLNGNLHGYGFYYIEKENQKIFYDGLFYANKLEGYGQIFYQDGSNYHGLFKRNKRFGPGVFTYPNGEQDVGLWDGFSILRLASDPHHDFVPKLSHSIEGNVRTLKYRNLVPICLKEVDIAQQVLEKLGASEEIKCSAYKLYNKNVRNKNHPFFNKKLYDDQFFDKQDCCIEILVMEDDQDEEISTEIEQDIRNEFEIISTRIEKLGKHVKKLDELLKGIENSKSIVLSKLNYCRNCCNIVDSPRLSAKSDEVIDIKVPEREVSPIEELSFASINSEDFNYVTPIESVEDLETPEIEKYLESICICQEAIESEDLSDLEKQLDVLLAEETFNGNIRDNMVSKIQTLRRIVEKRSNVKTKKVIVNEMLAWNNEQLLMDMLQHSFLHRESEKLTTLRISAILGGRRNQFSPTGCYERHCLDFLTECSLGGVCKLIEYLRKQNIHVNVSDSSGNTGIFYATAKYRSDMIRTLVNFGANLDQMNDEGLTPLNMSILCYLSQKNNIVDWETSFLSEADLITGEHEEVMKWNSGESFCSLSISQNNMSANSGIDEKLELKSEKKLTLEDPANSTKREKYFFDTTYRTYTLDPTLDHNEAKSEEVSGSFGHHEFVDDEVKLAQTTIYTLLECGANPNVGEAPLPPLIMSMFGDNSDLVKKLLDADADIHVVIPGENVTCLHIIAAARCTEENAKISSLLCQYMCDPNAKTDTNHWPEMKVKILGGENNLEDIEDDGKNPLHILCLRQDFETDKCDFFKTVCYSLIKSGIDIESTYLGLNALCLAVLSGNLPLVENLLASGLTDPYRILDPRLGNVLTLFFSERFKGILPVDQCIKIIDFLVNFGVSPLHLIGEFENAIAFVDRESVGKRSKKEKRSITPQKNKNNPTIMLKNHLKELSRKMILSNIQMKAVENLYNLAYASMLDHQGIQVLAEYLTPEMAINNLKLLFNYGRINIEQFDKEVCLTLLDYIDRNKKVLKQKTKTKQSGKKVKVAKTEQPETYDYKTIIDKASFHEIPSPCNSNLLKPGLDDPGRYDVCFECLHGRNKKLVSCTRCHLIHFCSVQCNKLNLKKKNNEHICATNVITDEKRNANLNDGNTDKKNEEDDLRELCELARDKSRLIISEKNQQALKLLMRREEEERKSDPYGTKLLRKKKLVAMMQIPSKTKCNLSVKVDSSLVEKNNAKSTPYGSFLLSTSLDEKLQRLSNISKSHSMSHNSQPMITVGPRERNKRTQTHKFSKRKNECSQPKCTYDEGEKKIASKTPLDIVSEFEPLPNLEEPYIIMRKTKNVPSKPQYFMDILKKYFPNMDLSYLLLPYICYSNGHLYYQFMDDDFFCPNYSNV